VGRFCVLLSFAVAAFSQDLTFSIPPVKTSIDIGDQPVAIVARGIVSGDQNSVRLRVSADLSVFQDHIGDLLRAELNRSDRCGERLSVDRAQIQPEAPAAALTAWVHYEKWVCVKALGKQINKRLVAGNASIPVKLTPAVNQNREVQLNADVGEIQADGSLGDLLRSDSFGPQLQEKIRASILSAINKGANLHATVPESLSGIAKIERAAFADSGGDRLQFELFAAVSLPFDQVRAMIEHR
jgi:hypothetical protein